MKVVLRKTRKETLEFNPEKAKWRGIQIMEAKTQLNTSLSFHLHRIRKGEWVEFIGGFS